MIPNSRRSGVKSEQPPFRGTHLFVAFLVVFRISPSSRIAVSVITTDSFGSVRELMKGWTPEAHGVFTDELTRARRQLASGFEAKSSTLTPVSAGTDIIGGLWHVKALLESGNKDDHVEREIWIWSDMVNETPAKHVLKVGQLAVDKVSALVAHLGRNVTICHDGSCVKKCARIVSVRIVLSYAGIYGEATVIHQQNIHALVANDH